MPRRNGKADWDASRPSPAGVKRALAKGDIEALRRALTPRQRLFAEEYVTDFDGKHAAIRAGYAPKWADRQASILLDHAGIMAYIDHLAKSNEAKVMSVNPDWVTQKTVGIVNTAEKVGDQLRALELLSKILGMLKDRTEISGPDGEAIRVQQQKVQEDAAELHNLIEALAAKRTFVITDESGQ